MLIRANLGPGRERIPVAFVAIGGRSSTTLIARADIQRSNAGWLHWVVKETGRQGRKG